MAKSILVGREQELTTLNDILSQAITSEPQLVLIEGEAGVGKSTLLERFLSEAIVTYPELVAVTGYCSSYSGDTNPLHPIRQISKSLLKEGVNKSKSANTLARNLKDIVWEIAPDTLGVFVPLGGIVLKLAQLANKAHRADQFNQESESFKKERAFEQFSQLLFKLSEKSPLLLLIEDIHWVDSTTIDFLFHLVRSWQDQPIMILISYRPSELTSLSDQDTPHPALRFIREIRRYALGIEISIRWLKEAELEAWVNERFTKHAFTRQFPKWLLEITEGNPLFVEQLLKHLQEVELIYLDTHLIWRPKSNLISFETIPSSLESVLEQRISRLSNQMQKVLAAASVEGELFTAEIAANTHSFDHEVIIDELCDVVDRKLGLVRELGERQTILNKWITLFEFKHSLMRIHLYKKLADSQRRRLHRRVGQLLEELYGSEKDVVLLAKHFSDGGDYVKAFQYAQQAGQQAQTSFDYESAIHWYRQTLLYADTLNLSDSDKSYIHFQLGQCERFRGMFQNADKELEAALSLNREDSSKEHADILSEMSWCRFQMGQVEAGIEIVSEAISINRNLGRNKRIGRDLIKLAQLHQRELRTSYSVKYLKEAAKILEVEQDTLGQARAIFELGVLARIQGDNKKSIQLIQKATQMFGEGGDKFWEARTLNNLASTFFNLQNDSQQALHFYKLALDITKEISNIGDEGHILLNLARLHAIENNWDHAFELVNTGIHLSEVSRNAYNRIRGNFYKATIQFMRQSIGGAFRSLEYALSIEPGYAYLTWGIQYNMGSLYLHLNNINMATEMFAKAFNTLLKDSSAFTNDEMRDYLISEQRYRVLLALQKYASNTPIGVSANSLLRNLPMSEYDFSEDQLPRFYWDGGRWTL